jgi:hypothetical protein
MQQGGAAASISTGKSESMDRQAGGAGLLQDLWELLEVTTVANAQVQSHHR